MNRRYKRKNRTSNEIAKIAKERVDILIALSRDRAIKGDLEYMHRYIGLAIAVANKYNVRLSREQKKHICRRCMSYLIYGKNSSIRIRNKMLVIRCFSCNHIKRVGVTHLQNGQL